MPTPSPSVSPPPAVSPPCDQQQDSQQSLTFLTTIIDQLSKQPIADPTTHEQQTFQDEGLSDCGQWEQESKSFQRYIEELVQREQYLQQGRGRRQKGHHREGKRVRYIERHSAPRNVFNYHGIDFEVLYGKYYNYTGQSLVLMYRDFTFAEIRKMNLTHELEYLLMQKYDHNTVDAYTQMYQVLTLSLNSPRALPYHYPIRHNYRNIHLIQQPLYHHQPSYSHSKLIHSISRLVHSICHSSSTSNNKNHDNNQTIVFRDFVWQGLSEELTAQTVIWTLMGEFYKHMKEGRQGGLGVKRVVFCCERQQGYYAYGGFLRSIGDEYVRNGLVRI